MASYRPMMPFDLLELNDVWLTPFMEINTLTFYAEQIQKFPEFCWRAEDVHGELIGYVMGKILGEDESSLHGRVTCLNVSHIYGDSEVPAKLVQLIEKTCESKGCLFMDMFIRVDSPGGTNFCTEILGFTRYQTVTKYFSDKVDALDMRKALTRDSLKKSLILPKDKKRRADQEPPEDEYLPKGYVGPSLTIF